MKKNERFNRKKVKNPLVNNGNTIFRSKYVIKYICLVVGIKFSFFVCKKAFLLGFNLQIQNFYIT